MVTPPCRASALQEATRYADRRLKSGHYASSLLVIKVHSRLMH
jgi:hypothetical protein